MKNHYHFIGIGGVGMSGLARLLMHQNISVSGSDITFNATIEKLIEEGAVIYKGQKAENIPHPAKVVYSSDIRPDNPEYQEAIRLQYPILHRSDLLAELLKEKKSLAVTGTHGKTTTTSLLASVLMETGLDPSFAIGGTLPAFQCNARSGKGEFFAFEADESDRSFLKYHPFGAIVTNIDSDHLNNYDGSEDLLLEAFGTFMSQVQHEEYLLWCGDDVRLLKLNGRGQRFGFNPNCDWRVKSFRQEGFKQFFDLEHQGYLHEQIEIPLAGRHNILNAAAVFGLTRSLGISEQNIRQAFRTFKGVLRRCEIKGSYKNVLFIDDYAHHPTEIQTTLEGIRKAIGLKRLIAVFQPHRYSRTQDCLGSYGSIFEDADEIVLTDIYGAGEPVIPNLTHELILKEILQKSSTPCRYVPRTDLIRYLSQFVVPDDVLVTLGAGDVTKVGSEILNLLEQQAY